jgi:hypothetical protein
LDPATDTRQNFDVRVEQSVKDEVSKLRVNGEQVRQVTPPLADHVEVHIGVSGLAEFVNRFTSPAPTSAPSASPSSQPSASPTSVAESLSSKRSESGSDFLDHWWAWVLIVLAALIVLAIIVVTIKPFATDDLGTSYRTDENPSFHPSLFQDNGSQQGMQMQVMSPRSPGQPVHWSNGAGLRSPYMIAGADASGFPSGMDEMAFMASTNKSVRVEGATELNSWV